jgi:hypothetical protein
LPPRRGARPFSSRRAKRSCRAYTIKRAVLDEIVRERSGEMIAPIAMAAPESPAGFFTTIEAFGATFLARLVDPTTTALYRLAISKMGTTDELGLAVEANGRARVFKRMRGYIGEGAARGFIEAHDLSALTEAYLDLLIGWLTTERLLAVRRRRTRRRFAAAPSARRER